MDGSGRIWARAGCARRLKSNEEMEIYDQKNKRPTTPYPTTLCEYCVSLDEVAEADCALAIQWLDGFFSILRNEIKMT